MMGAWLGWPGVLVALFLAYVSGAIFAIILLLTQKSQWGAKLPMGCFLAVATFIALHEGDHIISWYWGMLR
jgi:prepilin signal peptidase PulO-like enzyme (type II secretory pathway)